MAIGYLFAITLWRLVLARVVATTCNRDSTAVLVKELIFRVIMGDAIETRYFRVIRRWVSDIFELLSERRNFPTPHILLGEGARYCRVTRMRIDMFPRRSFSRCKKRYFRVNRWEVNHTRRAFDMRDTRYFDLLDMEWKCSASRLFYERDISELLGVK